MFISIGMFSCRICGTLIFEDLSSFCQNLEKFTLNYKNGVAESVGNGINRSISNLYIKQNGLKEIEFYCPNFNNVVLQLLDWIGWIRNNNFVHIRDLSNLEHVNWLNLESLSIDGINMEKTEENEHENENIENETENEHDSENEQQEQMQIEQQQQQQDEEEEHQEQQQQQQQQQQVVNDGLLLKEINIETDSLIPKSEHIKSYYQSLIRYCPNLEVVTIWYLDEYRNDFESLIKSCQNLKEITLIFADNLLGNDDIDDDATLSFIFNTLLNYVDDNFTVLNFGEGWRINVNILYEFLQRWKDKKPLFIWYHMETDIFDDHMRVFENFKELDKNCFMIRGVIKVSWKDVSV
ncbi:hypothetical protein RclHR1_02330012 [Rhizophagus clarus]|uniref:Uncharacterized protein n=1 Tax=Rhizophagus clarus TaxID=94130 RepID=A0A2Z6R913_9GLOM|nr:hypothetical protein RclHR1_02330012 [Rhizophagus clarus]